MKVVEITKRFGINQTEGAAREHGGEGDGAEGGGEEKRAVRAEGCEQGSGGEGEKGRGGERERGRGGDGEAGSGGDGEAAESPGDGGAEEEAREQLPAAEPKPAAEAFGAREVGAGIAEERTAVGAAQLTRELRAAGGASEGVAGKEGVERSAREEGDLCFNDRGAVERDAEVVGRLVGAPGNRGESG